MASVANVVASTLRVVNEEARVLAQVKVDAVRAGTSVLVGAIVVLVGLGLLITALFIALLAPLGVAGSAFLTGALAVLLGAGFLFFTRRQKR